MRYIVLQVLGYWGTGVLGYRGTGYGYGVSSFSLPFFDNLFIEVYGIKRTENMVSCSEYLPSFESTV